MKYFSWRIYKSWAGVFTLLLPYLQLIHSYLHQIPLHGACSWKWELCSLKLIHYS